MNTRIKITVINPVTDKRYIRYSLFNSIYAIKRAVRSVDDCIVAGERINGVDSYEVLVEVVQV